MNNYLAMLGWNDGTEKEIYTVEELSEAIFLYLLIPRLRNTNIIDKGQYLQAR